MVTRPLLRCFASMVLIAAQQLVSVPRQQEASSSAVTNHGTIQDGHTYTNAALGMTMPLPGSWEFMEVLAYATPEQKAVVKAEEERVKSNCSGPLCGDAEINEALQYKVAMVPLYSVFMLGYKLSPEYQDRSRHSLLGFAQVMTASTTSKGWIIDENLMPIRLSGHHAYRLLMHNAKNTKAKGFIYVADSNGFVFMLVATAIQQPDELQRAVENMKLPQDTH
jgi:hypothetical protein